MVIDRDIRVECRLLSYSLMAPRDFFINQWGRLRSGWRVAIFVGLYVGLLFVVGAILRVVYAVAFNSRFGFAPGPYIENVLFRLMFLIAAVLAGYICARALEGLPWRALGLSLHRSWFSHFAIGSIIGGASLLLAALIAWAGGGLSFSLTGRSLLFLTLRELISAAALFILAALAEEALFRGYPLQTLTRAQLAWLGVFLTSVPFAAVHLWNPNVARGFTFANTALAGIWLAVAYLRTRSLWFPLGVHWTWNWILNSVLGLPVSGITISSYPLFHGSDLGPAWLTGGTYGIEGGAACTVTLIISTLFIWRTSLVSATPEMLKLTSQENPAPVAKLSILSDERTVGEFNAEGMQASTNSHEIETKNF